MGGLLCKCGETMQNSDCPSRNKIYVYSKEEIDSAINDNPNISLIDFISDWDELHNCPKKYIKRPDIVDYWFCINCKRVYECNTKRWVRIFKPVLLEQNMDTTNWKEIIVFTDNYWDQATEKYPKLLLSDFIYKWKHDYSYKISPDEKVIIAYKYNTDKLELCYELEEKV